VSRISATFQEDERRRAESFLINPLFDLAVPLSLRDALQSRFERSQAMAKTTPRMLQAMFIALFSLSALTCGSSSHLSSLDISPISPNIATGDHEQFTATAHYDNGPDQDVTSAATWTSSNATVATISRGLATGLSEGSSNINASYTVGSSSVQAETDLTVNASTRSLH
jgi:Bacterial Ig-like domain (group 2)